MTKFLKPSYYSGRALEQQWINDVFTSHDLFCGCMKPIEHLNCIINNNKWLPTGDGDTKTTEDPSAKDTSKDDYDIDQGDLEKLFEDTDEQLG